MQTALADFIRETAEGREAEAILRSCVHCGFCLPACPTYQLLGDELDSPRGRIYLMKQLLEGAAPSAHARLHLDRCLTCRACESACPSGVEYGRLLDIGRALTEERTHRALPERLKRYLLRRLVPSAPPALLRLATAARPLLPQAAIGVVQLTVLCALALLGHRLHYGVWYADGVIAAGAVFAWQQWRTAHRRYPARRRAPRVLAPPNPGIARRAAGGGWPVARHARHVVLFEGCVQPALAPDIAPAAARVLDCVGISALRVPATGCCGALSHHLSARAEALAQARHNVDALWPLVQAGAEALVLTASACAAMVADYGRLLAHDPGYAPRAARVSALARDISQVMSAEAAALEALLARTSERVPAQPLRVAFQAPCTLQHALKLGGVVEPLLRSAGFTLTPVADGARCCGSAGSYSLLQPRLAAQLLENKVRALEAGDPQVIATANIGCLVHIRAGTAVPVQHWIELLAARLDS